MNQHHLAHCPGADSDPHASQQQQSRPFTRFLFEDDHEVRWTSDSSSRSPRLARVVGYWTAFLGLLLFSAVFGQIAAPKHQNDNEEKTTPQSIASSVRITESASLNAMRTTSNLGFGSAPRLLPPALETNDTFASIFAANGLLATTRNSLGGITGDRASASAAGANAAAAPVVQNVSSAAAATASPDQQQLAAGHDLGTAVPDTGSSVELLGLALATIGSGRFLFRRPQQPAFS